MVEDWESTELKIFENIWHLDVDLHLLGAGMGLGNRVPAELYLAGHCAFAFYRMLVATGWGF